VVNRSNLAVDTANLRIDHQDLAALQGALIAAGGAGGGSGVVIATPAPNPATSPVGELWFDSVGLQLYVNYNNAGTNTWVISVNQSGYVIDAASDGKYYGRRNAAWSQVLAAAPAGAVFTSLPTNAANDAAAASAGVVVGGIYRNGSILMVRVT
jgi:hypothetical protein